MIDYYLGKISDIWDKFINTYPGIGWTIAIIFFVYYLIKFLVNNLPIFTLLKAKIVKPIAIACSNNWLAKQAIDADIRGRVNFAVEKLAKELPAGWIKPLEIIWMKKEGKKDFIDENQIVLRMRPVKNQDENFVFAIYYFFSLAFFPETKTIIPEVTKEASILQISRRVIKSQKNKLNEVFEDLILEPAIQRKAKILDYLDRYEKIDKKGFFTGTFLRELNKIAKEVRFKQMRNNLVPESIEILKHIESFVDSKPKPNNIWNRLGPVTRYGFLLIAHPAKSKGGVRQYVNRAKTNLEQGVRRLYVYGTGRQEKFANKVINAIEMKIPEYRLIEKFELDKDYRGNNGGVGAIFETDLQ